MPISVIIERDKTCSVNESAVKGVKGLWINSDVKVFIPYEVLELANLDSEETFVPQDEARELFFKLEKLLRMKPLIFGQWEIEFLEGMTKWFDEGKMFSKRQKMKIRSIAESYADQFDGLENQSSTSDVEGDIPF